MKNEKNKKYYRCFKKKCNLPFRLYTCQTNYYQMLSFTIFYQITTSLIDFPYPQKHQINKSVY
jgi:hypothetical protein